MALIKCPECGKEISDKAPACIYCGYPLSLVSSTQNESAVESEQGHAEKNAKPKEYSFKINNCNGSNAKVIITLKNKFGYSLEDAKAAIQNLPLTISTNNTITEVVALAQEFTDAGIDYEVFRGEDKLSLNLVMKDKKVQPPPVSYSGAEEVTVKPVVSQPREQEPNGRNQEEPSGKGCRIYLILFCIFVVLGLWFIIGVLGLPELWWLVFPLAFAVFLVGAMLHTLFTTDPKELKEIRDTEKYNCYKFTCPMCGSKKVKKIGTINRAASVAAVGLASSKIGKQYECDDCKHKW